MKMCRQGETGDRDKRLPAKSEKLPEGYNIVGRDRPRRFFFPTFPFGTRQAAHEENGGDIL